MRSYVPGGRLCPRRCLCTVRPRTYDVYGDDDDGTMLERSFTSACYVKGPGCPGLEHRTRALLHWHCGEQLALFLGEEEARVGRLLFFVVRPSLRAAAAASVPREMTDGGHFVLDYWRACAARACAGLVWTCACVVLGEGGDFTRRSPRSRQLESASFCLSFFVRDICVRKMDMVMASGGERLRKNGWLGWWRFLIGWLMALGLGDRVGSSNEESVVLWKITFLYWKYSRRAWLSCHVYQFLSS